MYVQNTGDKFYTMNNFTTPKVYDLLHDILPDIHTHEWLTNAMIGLSFVPLLAKWNAGFFIEYVGLMLTIFIIRDIVINLTILPKHEKCEVSTGIVSHIVGNCYDKIFSAHFAVVFMLSLMYYLYKYITNIPVLIIWNLANALIIIASRSHYTIDIFVSILVCMIVYDRDLSILKALE